MIIETKISGIPCQVELLTWEKYQPSSREYEAEGGFGEWRVLDRKGKPAPWLEIKISAQEERAIDNTFFEIMERGE